MFSSASVSLFVCWQDCAKIKKNTRPIFTKLGEKVAQGPRKKRLDFRGNPDHVTLEIKVGLWI